MGTGNRLNTELRNLREAAGISGRAAAAAAGLSQSRLSRIERGAFLPTVGEVQTLCAIYSVPAKVRRQLVELAEAIGEEYTSTRVVLQHGAWRMQDRIRRVEESATQIRTFQPIMIPGLLQTPSYIREVFSSTESGRDLEAAVRARINRQELLLQSGRTFTFLLSEGSLCWNLGGPTVMVSQLEYLVKAMTTPHIRIGIISWKTTAPLPPVHAFHLYDSSTVLIGTLDATAFITDQRDIASYKKKFQELQQAASFDEQARAAINRTAREFRRLAKS